MLMNIKETHMRHMELHKPYSDALREDYGGAPATPQNTTIEEKVDVVVVAQIPSNAETESSRTGAEAEMQEPYVDP